MKTAIIYALNHGASEKVNRWIKFKRTILKTPFYALNSHYKCYVFHIIQAYVF
jgi:hypothetical protein